MALVGIACVWVYMAAFSVGPGTVPWLVAAEVFPQDSRPKALMLAVWTNCLCTFVIAMTFEHISSACGAYTFVIFAILIVFFVVFVFVWVPEARRKPMEEIAREMKVPLRCGHESRVTEQDKVTEQGRVMEQDTVT